MGLCHYAMSVLEPERERQDLHALVILTMIVGNVAALAQGLS